MSETAPHSHVPVNSKLFAALAKAQAKFVQPEKNKEVEVKKDGRVLYTTKYADLKNVIESFRPHLTEFGISFAQKTRQTDKGWRLVLVVRHESGEVDETEMPITLDGNVGPQQIGSNLTYLKRYQAAAYFGIAADDDDDANGAHGNQATFNDRGGKKNGKGEGQAQQQNKTAPAKGPEKKEPPPATKPAETKGKMASTDDIKNLISDCAALGVSEAEQKAMLQQKIGRPSWKDLTEVELLRAREGVAEFERARVPMPDQAPAEPDLDTVFPPDEPQTSPDTEFESQAQRPRNAKPGPGDFVMPFDVGDIDLKGKALKAVPHADLQAAVVKIDWELKQVPPPANLSTLFDVSHKLKSFLKSTGVA